jgi:hypothetical protein
MPPTPDDESLIAQLAELIRPLDQQIVVIGGWANRLHRRVDLAQQVDFEPLHTEDVDLATNTSLTPSIDIGDALTRAGFDADMRGDATPPATRYVLKARPDFYLQFVAQRMGDGRQRDGNHEQTILVGGVVAERLSHISILLMVPWRVELDAPIGGGHALPVFIHVANASCYMAQKLLIASRRDPRDRAKDLAYIYDTLMVFGGALPALGDLWGRIAPQLPRGTHRTIMQRTRELSSTLRDEHRDTSALLASLGRTHAPRPSEIKDALDAGFAQVFGPVPR